MGLSGYLIYNNTHICLGYIYIYIWKLWLPIDSSYTHVGFIGLINIYDWWPCLQWHNKLGIAHIGEIYMIHHDRIYWVVPLNVYIMCIYIYIHIYLYYTIPEMTIPVGQYFWDGLKPPISRLRFKRESWTRKLRGSNNRWICSKYAHFVDISYILYLYVLTCIWTYQVLTSSIVSVRPNLI